MPLLKILKCIIHNIALPFNLKLIFVFEEGAETNKVLCSAERVASFFEVAMMDF